MRPRASNLARAQAQERSALLRVHSYDVVLDLSGAQEPAQPSFRSRTTVRFACARAGASTFVDLAATGLHSAVLDGRDLDTDGFDPATGLALGNLGEQNTLVVEADLPYSHTGEGLHRFVDPVDGQTYLHSHFEVADAQRMYACFDQPDLKATFTLHVTVPAHWQTVSNGPVDGVDLHGATKTVHFAPTPPLSSYVTALMAGPFHVVRAEHDGIELGVWCRSSLAPYLDAEEILEVTRQGFDWYHAHLGQRYAFGKYDQLFVPGLDVSAMENAGCVTFREDHLFRGRVTEVLRERRAETMLHEMAHMWFGNLVTTRWWDDVWLNESLATYAASLCQAAATRWTGSWNTFANTEKSRGHDSDQLPSTHPVAADIADLDEAEVSFDGITYMKGATLLRQLGERLGEPVLLAGLRDYLARHAFGNASLADLLAAVGGAAGQDLTEWSRSWLETSGANTLRLGCTTGPDRLIASCAIEQSAPTRFASDNTLRSHRLAVGSYDLTAAGRLTRTDRVEVDVDGARTALPQLVGRPRPALLLVDDGDRDYAKLRLDTDSLAALREHGVASVESDLARAQCWALLWDMTRDAQLRCRDYLDLVLAAAGRERDIGILQSLINRACHALDHYADPDWAPTGYGLLADTARTALHEVPAGCEAQLAWFGALLSAAHTAGDLSLPAALLDGTQAVEGLAVDVELRWSIVDALAVRGVANEETIAAELARDPSAHGQCRAAGARARLPLAETKAQAWRLAVEEYTVSNAMRAAVIGGFGTCADAALLQPYVGRYCAEVADAWDRLVGKPARHVAGELFPAWPAAISAGTLAAVDALLAEPELPRDLRRLVGDGRARLVRDLAARECDADAQPA